MKAFSFVFIVALLVGGGLVAFGIAQPTSPAPLQQQNAKTVAELLSADTVVYVQWDGLAAHRMAWEQTAAYAVLYKTTLAEFCGEAIEQLIAAAASSAGEGDATLGRDVGRALNHLGDAGLTLAVAVGENPMADFSVTLVAPDAGKGPQHDALVALVERAMADSGFQRQSVRRQGRQLVQLTSPQGMQAAWWSEGDHLVFTFGPQGADAVLSVAAGNRPNLTGNPLYQQYAAPVAAGGFDQAAVAWVDARQAMRLLQAMPVQPPVTLGDVLADLGFDGLQSVAVQWGFLGKRLQTLITVQAPAPRRGLLSMLDQEPFALDELPPLPAAGTFYAFSLDTSQLYDEGLATVRRVIQRMQPDAAPMVDRTAAQINAVLGFDLREDLLAHLGHTCAVSQEGGGLGMAGLMLPAMALGAARSGGFPGTPGMMEIGAFAMLGGMNLIGNLNAALILEVKDADAVRQSMQKLDASLNRLAEGRLTITRRDLAGTTIKLYRLDQTGMFLTPTVAVTDRWLIIGTYPQPVQAALLRADGSLPRWQPTPDLREALAGLPDSYTALSISDPRPAVEMLLGLLPMGASLADSSLPGVELDTSLVPPVEQITRHLFDNVSVTVVDDDSVKIISRSSVPTLPSLDAGSAVATTGVLAALLLPAVQRARMAARRVSSQSNERQTALALHQYNDRNRALPSGTHPNAQLEPQERFSWLADLLPFVEQSAVFDRLDFDQAWDAPVNRQAASARIDVWLNPGLSGEEVVNGYGATHYVGVAGVGADAATLPADHKRAGAFGADRKIGFGDVKDGTSNTMAILEVSAQIGPWAAGGPGTVRPLTRRPYLGGPDGFGGVYPGGAGAAMLDASVRFLSENIDPKVLEAMATTNGGEEVPLF